MKQLVKELLALLVRLTGGPTGPHVTRYFMYRRMVQIGETLRPASGARTLSISDSLHLCSLLGLADTKIDEANYPAANILALPFEDEAFDFVVSDQVFEHIEGDPFGAMAETLRVLRPGGVLVHTTCFINPVHGFPGDFWRFTPDALALMAGGGVEVIEAAGWGNRMVWIAAALGFRRAPVPHATWHPLHWVATRNNPLWPLATWVVARKR